MFLNSVNDFTVHKAMNYYSMSKKSFLKIENCVTRDIFFFTYFYYIWCLTSGFFCYCHELWNLNSLFYHILEKESSGNNSFYNLIYIRISYYITRKIIETSRVHKGRSNLRVIAPNSGQKWLGFDDDFGSDITKDPPSVRCVRAL